MVRLRANVLAPQEKEASRKQQDLAGSDEESKAKVRSQVSSLIVT